MFCKHVLLPRLLGIVLLIAGVGSVPWWQQHLSAAEEDRQAADSSSQVFLLATQFHPIGWVGTNKISGSLHRELVRQGLLIAARDELGLPTRDQTLREALVDSQGAELTPLEISSDARMDKTLRASLSRREGDEPREIWRAQYDFPLKSYFVYIELLKQIEADSRTGMVEALRKAGYEERLAAEAKGSRDGAPAKPREDTAKTKVPEKIEQLLSIPSFAPQFFAVRWAHRANRPGGQSPASLGVLVRGYAHLGSLTRYYFNSMSRAFTARSLVYAERMVVAYPDSSEALWHRAYARAIVGLHAGALTDLEQIAEKFGEKEPPADRLPACLRLIEPCCQFNSEGLLAAAAEDKTLLPLAHFLSFHAVQAIGDKRMLQTTCREALEYCPDTYEIYDALGKKGALGITRWAARAAPAAMVRYLPARLNSAEDLPASVKRLAAEGQPGLMSRLFGGAEAPSTANSHEVAAALVTAGRVGTDTGEPSWAVLGRMIQEVNFLQCVQILHDRRNAVRVPLGDVVDRLWPLVEGHPYAAYVERFRVEYGKEPQKYAEILKDLQIVEPQFHMYSWFRRIWNVETQQTKQLGRDAVSGCSADFTAYSQMHRHRYPGWNKTTEKNKRMMIREFQEISPNSPMALLTEIELQTDPSEDRLRKWERQAKHFPGSLRAIAGLYLARKDYDAAIRCYESSIEISPNVSAFRELASAYEAHGKPELWQPTLERYLKEEDFGLGHAQICSSIANRLMDQRKWEEAKPYALRAAGTYSAWGLRCAARCCEGLDDWEQSELWSRRLSESYGGYNRMSWFLWCRRNGRGDLEAAREVASRYALAPGTAVRSPGFFYAGVYHLLQGERRKALDLFGKEFKAIRNPGVGIHILLLAVELEDTAARDEVSKLLAEYLAAVKPNASEPLVRYTQIVQSTLRSKDPLKPDLKAMASVAEDVDASFRVDAYYMFGRMLELTSEREKAAEYYRQALATGQFSHYSCTLAGAALHKNSDNGE